MMITSSIRKLGVAGIASLLLVSGLATSTLTAQATQSGPITLLESPALGSLSSLGGVSGYVASQAGGDVNSWLSSQGIDPTASGSITDTTIPDEAKDTITISNGTASLAADATGVDVGYLAGDAMGADTVSAALSDVSVSPGHENDAYPMTQKEFLTWLNGTTWKGNFSMSGVASFSVTVAWSLSGAKVTPGTSTAANLALASQLQKAINNGIATPGTLKLSDVVAGVHDYSWSDSSRVPYSYAYSVGQGLTPGGSVSVDLSDVVSQSQLNDFNIDNAQTSGALASIPLETWLPQGTIGSLSSLDGFANFADVTTTADMVSLIVGELMDEGAFDTWVSNVVILGVQSVINGINDSGMGYTMQPLTSAAKSKIQANTPAVMDQFVSDGFPALFAQGVSASLQVSSAFDPGTVTSLIPTGVTYTAPIEVDTAISTLSLSDSTMIIDPGVCTGGPSVDPQSVTATATVIDTTGAPVAGADVHFSVESPLELDKPIHPTEDNGVATATITLPDLSLSDPRLDTEVTAYVDFGSGADLTPVELSIQRQVSEDNLILPSLVVTPTVTSPVYANGDDSYTASITFLDQCGVPQPGKVVNFSVTGSAQLSTASATSDENGVASVTLTDAKVERVTVSATDSTGIAIAGPATTVPFSYMPCTGDQCVAQVPVGGTLTIDPSEVPAAGSTVALATVIDGVGDPVPGVLVNFSLDGNALFSNGSISASSPTDGVGQAVMAVNVSNLDCYNLGFDVYATITVSGQAIDLDSSPAHASVIPPDGACEIPATPPQVEVANATVISGNGYPNATIQVTDAAGAVLGTSRVDTTGHWSIPTPAGTPSQKITANSQNNKGVTVASTTASLDTAPPAPARIDQATTVQVSGIAEGSSTVTVTFPDGSMNEMVANANGSYVVTTPDGMVEGVVSVLVTDQAGNRSDPATANLVTYVPPASKVTMNLRSTQVQIGGIQVVSGWGFRYLERVSAKLCSSTCNSIGNGYADLNGKVTINFVVPDSTIPGTYTVTLTGSSGTASASFEVPAPTAPSESRENTYLLLWAKWWWLLLLNR